MTQVGPDGLRRALQGRHPAHGLLAGRAVPVLRAPGRQPRYGAHWVDTALQSLFANPDVWEHTVFLLMYDENDGYFDQSAAVPARRAPPEEFVDGQADRAGQPGAAAGRLAVVARRLGQLPGLRPHLGAALPGARHRCARAQHQSAWRRTVCGDLTSCFDFAQPDYSIPGLPGHDALMAQADAGSCDCPRSRCPPRAASDAGAGAGGPPAPALPTGPWADVVVDRATGGVTCADDQRGERRLPLHGVAQHALPFTGTPFPVRRGAGAYVWDAVRTDGRYDFTVYGADGFLRHFAGVLPKTDDGRYPTSVRCCTAADRGRVGRAGTGQPRCDEADLHDRAAGIRRGIARLRGRPERAGERPLAHGRRAATMSPSQPTTARH